ncbi:hypothetical protein ACXR2W_00800 [Leucobacter sp. HY1908]
MQFDGSVLVFRRRMVENPANPVRPIPGPWSEADSWELEGASLQSTGGVEMRGDGRLGSIATVTLYLDNPDADLRKGDGVAAALDAVAPDFVVNVVPVVNRNPFTGWTPAREVPLKEVNG